MSTADCPFCGSKNISLDNSYSKMNEWTFYSCPVCGRYELDTWNRDLDCNKNLYASFLFYNRYSKNPNERKKKYHSFRSEAECQQFRQQSDKGLGNHEYPFHVDDDIVGAWYPKTFAERTDCIIKYLGEHIVHTGQRILLSYNEILSLLFIDRYDIAKTGMGLEYITRSHDECEDEARYMLDSLVDAAIIEYDYDNSSDTVFYVRLTPKGYARVDEIQKNTSSGKAVLVAMKFGDDTRPLREAIRLGIQKAGYVAVFIDEVQHNDFITPELLKHIRDSKFVVADLTHQNNGAYFEEGYAMGLGKPVIQLCQQDTKLHFDIAQKNTIMWQVETDIPEKLCNRIMATVE